jgi:hypothetical protein
MPRVHLRHSNGIQPSLSIRSADSFIEFQQPSGYNGRPIDLKISLTGDALESSCSVELRQELATSLSETPPGELAEAILQDVRKLFAPPHVANQRPLSLITQELELDEPRILTSRASQWSFDGHTWATLPRNITMTGASLRPVYDLDSEWKEHLQAVFDLREEPFIAFEHLHEARRGRDARFTWIEATIAAELAIKEALSRLEPRLTNLLLEVPAPPLRKLYGVILEGVAGEKSPYIKQLHEGAEIRNRLVHRPKAEKLDPQQVVDYVAVVDRAIWHLYFTRLEMKLFSVPFWPMETDIRWMPPQSPGLL